MKLNDAVRADIGNAVLCWLATVAADGTPNVTPKEIFAGYGDDHIVVADIASSNTVRNIRSNPKVCVSFVDVFRQKGFKITGTADIVGRDDPAFPVIGAALLEKAGPDFPIRNVISIGVERIARIWAPSYALFPDRTEDERMQSAYDAYGVRPLER